MIRIVVMCHAVRPCVATKGVGDTTWVRKEACDCYYSGVNGSGYDYNSLIHGCPVEEHSLVGNITLDFKIIIMIMAIENIYERQVAQMVT